MWLDNAQVSVLLSGLRERRNEKMYAIQKSSTFTPKGEK